MGSLFDEAARHIRPVDFVVDIGPGIRPQPFLKPKRHLCIEPHWEYAAWLKEHGYEVIQASAPMSLPPCDTVMLLDVIEHLEKVEGQALIESCRQAAREQVVVFTPFGFKTQSYQEGEKDAWGMSGTYWQTHRSGWTPKEFPGWTIIRGEAAVPCFFAILG